jgi:hypothetical protein
VIERISLSNFKCFETLDLDLAPLTLFTGFNAAGKSTTIQTLLLIAQTLRGQRAPSELLLNGSLVSLGNPGDVINTRGGSSGLALGVAGSGASLSWQFTLLDEERRSLAVSQMDLVTSDHSLKLPQTSLSGIRPKGENAEAQTVLAAIEGLIYLGAARQVETEVFPVPQDFGLSRGDVGPIGQFAPWWFYDLADEDVAPGRSCHGDSSSLTIRHQTNAWTADIFPGAEINSVPVPRTNLMRLELRSSRTNDWGRPTNIGYGVSYAFPLLVAGLCADAGRTVIVDSPEAHLHPRGQSRIGAFLAQMAASGVQMIAETHSDHVLNGIRIALRNQLIRPDQVALYFFTGKQEAPVIRLEVDRFGTIREWPEGFFDQSERDLASLAGWND